MWVCLCRGVNSGTIVAAIDDGAVTVKQVAAACGAATDCTKCSVTVKDLIRQRLESQNGADDE